MIRTGDCATICTIIFDNREHALKVSRALGSKTVDESGWHVYANMEHVLHHLKKVGQPHEKGAKTDDILSRAMNISIGVVDSGLGAGWGININSSDDEIEKKAQEFIKACH